MATKFYYVYALKDPRSSPAMPFYIGKGTGSRAYDHLVTPDRTLMKYARIQEIESDGKVPLVTILVDDVSEAQALQLEAELIAAFGTETDRWGIADKQCRPFGTWCQGTERCLVVPQGCIERAQLGLSLLKDAILELVKANPKGITNSEAASFLGLRSDYRGRQKDYLSYSVLGLLLREGKVERSETRPPRHLPNA